MPKKVEFYEVDVPIHDTTRTLRGLHVFTGQATSPSAALTRAHEVYDAALAARKAGLAKPGRQDGGWGASGVRDGWELDWRAAKAGVWSNPFSWTTRSSFELDTPRGRRSRPGNRRLPRATHPVRNEREPQYGLHRALTRPPGGTYR